MLLRWMNIKAKQGHSHRTMSNFSADLQDGDILFSVVNTLQNHWSLTATPVEKIEHAIGVA